MIKVIQSKYSELEFDDLFIDRLNTEANEHFPSTTELQVSISFYRNEGSDKIRSRCLVKHNEQDIIEDHEVNEPIKCIAIAVDRAISQDACSHSFLRKRNSFGIEYPDGTGACIYCGFEKNEVLPKIHGKQLAKIADSPLDKYITCFDWTNNYIQTGKRGLVIHSKRGKHYNSAFFEAFPKINGLSTFIRGEGDSIEAAELSAWEKFQSFLECLDHDWSRTVYGEEATDGYAKCLKCGLVAKALKPTTKCDTCGKPTSNKWANGDYVCLTHYYDCDVSVLVKDNAETRSKYDNFDGYTEEDIFHKTSKDNLMDFTRKLTMKAAFSELGEDYFERNLSTINNCVNHYVNLFLFEAFGFKVFRRLPSYPSHSDEKFEIYLKYFIGNILMIVDGIINNDDKATSNANFIKKNIIQK